MKRVMYAIVAVLVLFVFGCKKAEAKKAQETASGKRLSIVTSFYPMYIMALNVAGNVPGVRVVNMTPPVTGCLHDYTVTTDDMKKMEGASIFVANGAGMESFLDKIVGQFPACKVAKLSDGIPLISGEEGDNPHVWVSIGHAMTQVENLARFLAAEDVEHADLYRTNADAYIAKLKALSDTMHERLVRFKGRKIVTFHEAFPYFAREFDLDIAAVIEREPGSEPSAKELAETVDLVRSSGIKALFAEPQYPSTAADTISRETGAKVYILDPAVTGPDSPDAYLAIMKKNLAVMEEALSNQ